MQHDDKAYDFWKAKIMAFMHDPPHKALLFRDGGVHKHEDMALSLARELLAIIHYWHEKDPGPKLSDEQVKDADSKLFKETVKDADHTASAADRVAFPRGKAKSSFTGKPGETFRHPLSGDEIPLKNLPVTAALAEELLQKTIGGIKAEDIRHLFFFLWRRWMEEVVKTEGGAELAFLPADTRLPDHTIWNHMAVTSALQACKGEGVDSPIKPAFLLFQLGPVQDFIAAARSTRDLWSGSYLLSWLTAHAIKAVTDRVGPDAIIFPTLRGQGIYDILHRDIYEKIEYADGQGGFDSLWDRMYLSGKKHDTERLARVLLNPTLPNRFLALVPSLGEAAGEKLAVEADQAIRQELNRISESCWNAFRQLADGCGHEVQEEWKERWDAQVAAWPQISWSVTPWSEDIAVAITRHSSLRDLHELATKIIPINERDARFYKAEDGEAPKTELKNSGFLWPANLETAERLMASSRNTRIFAQQPNPFHPTGLPKDALTGRDEIIGNKEEGEEAGSLWDSIGKEGSSFKKDEGPYSAMTIIKRLWCGREGYLCSKAGIKESDFNKTLRFESVEDIAHQNEDKSGYVAVLALDGDQMGKHLSGELMPPFLNQLSSGARQYYADKMPEEMKGMLRVLSPSYHLQFSETLSNFANHVAGKIVAHYQGQLIYAGGDDVLAILPADKAVRCAWTLRDAFRGKRSSEEAVPGLDFVHDGLLSVEKNLLLVPGPGTDISCGIAIAHFKHPLQQMVSEALQAEKRAKLKFCDGGLERKAFSVSLIKRSGETIHWNAKWDSGALQLYELYSRLRGRTRDEQTDSPISARFPYALAALLKPYELEKGEFISGLDPVSLITAEFEHVLSRQAKRLAEEDKARLREAAKLHLEKLKSECEAGRRSAFGDFVELFLTEAFISRPRGEED